jgi:hypothetical protein
VAVLDLRLPDDTGAVTQGKYWRRVLTLSVYLDPELGGVPAHRGHPVRAPIES